MIEFLEIVNKHFELSEKPVADEFVKFSMNGMDFSAKLYYAKNFGTVSHLHCDGMQGAMKMETIVICPLEKEADMVSYDRILAMGNDTLIFERYQGTELLEHTEKKGASADTPEFDKLASEKLLEYLKIAEKLPACDVEKQSKKIENYREWLVENPGIATDNFNKSLGKEKTKEFFTKVLFSSKIC